MALVVIEHLSNKVYASVDDAEKDKAFIEQLPRMAKPIQSWHIFEDAKGVRMAWRGEPDHPIDPEQFETLKAQFRLPALFDNQRFIVVEESDV